jgi:opacity protein-like surface antigen
MKNALAGILAVLMTGTSAFAADLYQAEPAPAYVEAPEVQITQASGWYLRGDVGYSINKLRGANNYQGGPGG